MLVRVALRNKGAFPVFSSGPFTALAAILLLTFSHAATAAEAQWKTIRDEAALSAYIRDEFHRSYYPTKVSCRKSLGAFQIRLNKVPAGPDKPYHKWNATLLRPNETPQDAAARLPIKGFPEAKYRAKFVCSAAGKTLVVAFRGTRKLD